MKNVTFVVEHMNSPAAKALMEILWKIEDFLKKKELETPAKLSSSTGGTET